MVKILVLGDFHGKVHPSLKKIKDYDFILCTGDFADTTKLRELEFKHWDNLKRKGKTLEKILGKEKYAQIVQPAISSMRVPLKFLESTYKPVYAIYGNADFLTRDTKKFEKKGLDYLCKNLKITLLKTGYASTYGITIAGFSGYRGAVDKGLVKIDKYTKKEIKKRNLNWDIRLKTLFNDVNGEEVIFLAHDVPKGVFDKVNNKFSPLNGKHVGDEYFTKYILKYKPKLFICGHMHEYQGMKRLGKTLVINPGPAYEGKAAIIDYSDKIKVKFIK